jgi:hypothetical protein
MDEEQIGYIISRTNGEQEEGRVMGGIEFNDAEDLRVMG